MPQVWPAVKFYARSQAAARNIGDGIPGQEAVGQVKFCSIINIHPFFYRNILESFTCRDNDKRLGREI
jgi:hypothetical protein